jgi:hypothetical protein
VLAENRSDPFSAILDAQYRRRHASVYREPGERGHQDPAELEWKPFAEYHGAPAAADWLAALQLRVTDQ